MEGESDMDSMIGSANDNSLSGSSDSVSTAIVDKPHSGAESDARVSKGEQKVLYQYTDYGQVQHDAQGLDHPVVASNEASIRAQKFPVKLDAILSQKAFHHIIAWMPHGRSWKVLKPKLFETIVMPLYFEYSNYHSFNRLVNAWSFRRVSHGPDRGSYYNEVRRKKKSRVVCDICIS
jgi:hypothetical protein